MKNKYINIFKTIILSLIIAMSATNICNAEVDINAVQGYFNAKTAQLQINQSNNPKYADRYNQLKRLIQLPVI